MSLSLFLPFLYLIIGMLFSKITFDIRKYAALLLTKWIIPSVIIFNIATYKNGFFTIIFGTMVMMLVMFLVSQFFTKDAVTKLCFFYLNIGWLGLPIASSVWGEQAATIYIASYIGNSIFGNAMSAGLLAHHLDVKTRVIHILKSPPVIALLIGLLLMPWGTEVEAFLKTEYVIVKFIMSFLGMSILGIWMANTKIRRADLWLALKTLAAKFILVALLISLFVFLADIAQIELITQNKAALYLIGLLPPAANIVGLETYYLKTGKSASIIACGTLSSIVAIMLYIFIVQAI